MTASLHRLLHGLNIRDLTKLRRRRERERERRTSNSFNEQNNSARAWRFFTNSFAVSAQQGREMANFLSVLENRYGKVINSTLRGPLSYLNSHLLSNMVTWNHGEIVCKDEKCVFQRRLNGRRRCWIVRFL